MEGITTTTITVETDTVETIRLDAPPFDLPHFLDDLRRDRRILAHHLRVARDTSEADMEARVRHLCDAVELLAGILLPEGGDSDGTI